MERVLTMSGIKKMVDRAWRLEMFRHGVLAALMLFGLTVPVLAQAQATGTKGGNALESVDASNLPGNRVQIKFTLSAAAPDPISFTINNPARIALDFPDTENKMAKRTTQVGLGVARSVNVVEARGRTRVVLNLVQLVPYETRVDGKNVYITLEGASAGVSSPPVDKKPAAFSSRETPTSFAIKSIDFRRGDKGEGRILVTLSDPGTNVNIQQQGGKLALDFTDTNVPAALEQRLDVTDFATPVTLIDTFRQGNNVRMVITGQGQYEHMAYQSGNLMTIEVRKSVEKDMEELKRKGDQRAFGGERLSLNFQNIEVRAVLQLIADFTSMNLVTSDTVTGSLTLRLQNVPWDQALDIILRTKGLAMREMGSVMYIGPSEEIAAREKQELEAKKQITELEPLFSDLIQINYAKASDIQLLLRGGGVATASSSGAASAAGSSGRASSLLSTRGTVTFDARTNTLLVQETASKLDEIRKLITVLDIPVRQVLIESRIVIANSGFDRSLGSRFGVSRDTMGAGSSGRGTAISGNLKATDQLVNNQTLAAPERLNVNLPVPAAAGSFALSMVKLPFGTNVDLELSAMQIEGKGEVVSSPRVITANQKEATIEQGVEIAYQESSSAGATTVSFKKAVLSLRVTPQITPDDRVIMDLQVNKDSVGEIFFDVPSINTREIKTQVLVENGETIVLGGVFEQETRKDTTKVPFLGDLPLIGALFRSKSEKDGKEELLVFITPKIVKEGLSLN